MSYPLPPLPLCGRSLLLSACCLLGTAPGAALAALNPTVSFTTIAPNAYAVGDVNSCGVSVNNLVSAGGYQFAAYYHTSGNLRIARRALGESTWTNFSTAYSITSGQLTDDHNVISMGIDGTGKLHLSWNMHNIALNYAISDTSVLTQALPSLNFTTRTAANTPTLFPSGGNTANSVTYPQFYNIPGSNNLLFTYRNGASGSGNQYVNVYNPGTGTFTQSYFLNGVQTSVNGYTNTLAYTSTGQLMASWTWRLTPDWRTNTNILFAQSDTHGATWERLNGVNYTTPLVQAQSGNPLPSPNQVAQVIKTLPQGSALINQASMAVTADDRPVIATWWAPGWTPTSPSTGSGNPNRQYMLVYHNGAEWLTSQITNRTSDTVASVIQDGSATNVRDMGRPIVLVDDFNRVLVVMRSIDSGIHIRGTGNDPTVPGNNLVVAYTEDLMNGGTVISNWTTLTLDTANMGSYEPQFDRQLWESQNKLHLYYERMGFTGQTTGAALQVLEWDAKAYFAAIPEPGTLALLGLAVPLVLRRRR